MAQECVEMDRRSFIFALKACEQFCRVLEGQSVHCWVWKMGFDSDLVVRNGFLPLCLTLTVSSSLPLCLTQLKLTLSASLSRSHLTHASEFFFFSNLKPKPSVRKQHNAGYKHKANVRSYYQQFEEAQTQNFIDQRIKEHLGQTAAFQQVGAAYNQHLMVQRPRLPVLPTPVMLMPGSTQLPGSSPLIPGIRPPVLQRPLGAPGYMPSPAMAPMMAPPGAPSLPA
nr:u1 small nuclear ribonucleoprotein c [Quercus suber]